MISRIKTAWLRRTLFVVTFLPLAAAMIVVCLTAAVAASVIEGGRQLHGMTRIVRDNW